MRGSTLPPPHPVPALSHPAPRRGGGGSCPCPLLRCRRGPPRPPAGPPARPGAASRPGTGARGRRARGARVRRGAGGRRPRRAATAAAAPSSRRSRPWPRPPGPWPCRPLSTTDRCCCRRFRYCRRNAIPEHAPAPLCRRGRASLPPPARHRGRTQRGWFYGSRRGERRGRAGPEGADTSPALFRGPRRCRPRSGPQGTHLRGVRSWSRRLCEHLCHYYGNPMLQSATTTTTKSNLGERFVLVLQDKHGLVCDLQPLLQ